VFVFAPAAPCSNWCAFIFHIPCATNYLLTPRQLLCRQGVCVHQCGRSSRLRASARPARGLARTHQRRRTPGRRVLEPEARAVGQRARGGRSACARVRPGRAAAGRERRLRRRRRGAAAPATARARTREPCAYRPSGSRPALTARFSPFDPAAHRLRSAPGPSAAPPAAPRSPCAARPPQSSSPTRTRTG
jgi:hypothetical protein